VRAIRNDASTVTPAEERVLKLISQSLTNREIAELLRISPATVKRHVENIFRKLGLRNRVEAAIYGLMMSGRCPVEARAGCPLAEWRSKCSGESKIGPFAP